MHADTFLADILAHPRDNAPRLRYADWLDEHCLPLGEFIRVQCQLAGKPTDPGCVLELERRERELLAVYENEWVHDLPEMVSWWTFRRGFVEEIGVTSRQFLDHASDLFRLAPIQIIHFDRLKEEIETVASSAFLERAAYLDLSNNPVRDAGARLLAQSPRLASLRGLNLSSSGIGDSGLRALAASPHLRGLRELYLCDNRISSSGVRALAGSPLAQRLDVLHLRFNDIGTDGAELLQRRLGSRAHF